MDFLLWIIITFIDTTVIMSKVMGTRKFKSWYPLISTVIIMWVSTLLSFTVTKYTMTAINYFRTCEFEVVQNGVKISEKDTVVVLTVTFIVLMIQTAVLVLANFARNTDIERSPLVMTLYYITGDIIALILSIYSIVANLQGLSRVDVTHSTYGYLITFVYFVVGNVLWLNQMWLQDDAERKDKCKAQMNKLISVAGKKVDGSKIGKSLK